MKHANCPKRLGTVRIMMAIWLAMVAPLLAHTWMQQAAYAAANQSPTERFIPIVKSKAILQARVELESLQDTPVSVRVYAVDSEGNSSEPLGGQVEIGPYGKRIVEAHEIPATASFLKVESAGSIQATSILVNRAGNKSEAIAASETSTTLDFSFFTVPDAIHGSLYLVNSNPVKSALEFTAYSATGTEIGKASLPRLDAFSSRAIPLKSLFNANILRSLTTLRLTSTEAVGGFRLSNYPMGDLVGLPGQSAAALCWVFDIPRELEEVSLKTFIGILNVGGNPATLKMESFDRDGNSVGLIDGISLNPGATTFLNSKKATAVPASAAYVKISSDQPAKGFQLFRTLKGHGVAAALGTPGCDTQTAAARLTGEEDGNVLGASAAPKAQAGSAESPLAVDGTITVTSPNGGEIWGASTTRTITWNATANSGKWVNIDLYKGNPTTGLSWKGTIASNLWIGSGSFTWLVWYNVESGNDYWIRVRSDAGIEDYNDAQFTLKKSTITVTSPAGGEQWEINTPHTIRWTYTGTPGTTVTIDLYKKGSWMGTIASGVPIGTSNTGSLTWKVWPTLAPGSNYKIRVTSNRGIEDYSNTNFALTPSGITVAVPSATDIVWKRGTRNTIKWTHKTDAGSYVTIDLYKGDSWRGTIASNVNIGATGGSYLWTIPSGVEPGTDYKIRLTTDLGYTDYSNNTFAIKGSGIAVTSPAWPPPSFTVGRVMPIAWSYVPYAGTKVTVDLYKGGAWRGTIASGVSIGSGGVGSMNWLIPVGTEPGTDYLVRVTTDYNFTDYCDHQFEIALSGFMVLSPNGGTFHRNGHLTVTWSVQDFTIGEYVTIDLYKGESWRGTIGTGLWIGSGITGFTWLIPSDIELGTDYRIRATTDWGVTDYTDNYFTIAN